MRVRSAATAFLALMVTASLGLPANAAYATAPDSTQPSFTLEEVSSGKATDIAPVTGERLHDLTVTRSSDGTLAIVDRSMVDQGVVAAAGTSFVDLSWAPHSATAEYGVSRDGVLAAELPAGITEFRDTSVVGGKTYRYNITPLSGAAASDSQAWSMLVRVPLRPSAQERSSIPLVLQLAAAPAATTTITWETFIPHNRIDGPPAGCEYGSGYQYGGDNRSYDWTSSSYRTAVNAVITWSSKAVAGHTSVGLTNVYRKSDGVRVAQRRAAIGSNMFARKLSSGSNYVDVRMSTYSSNPFCSYGAIAGAFSMHLTTSGNYNIVSGSHRQMPNHHVYIYDGGAVFDVYRRNYVSLACLIGPILCPTASMYGSGTL